MAWQEEKQYDVVVVGGGMAGICAALAAARNGASTAILQDRSVWGGNASSEVRMHIGGASCHGSKKNLSESGILLELLLENKRRNPYQNYSIWDSVLWEKLRYQPGLDSYLNTSVRGVEMAAGRIQAVCGYQSTTETEYTFRAHIFVDATGHGTVGVAAGAKSRMGSEGKAELNEPSAQEEPNADTMGNTIMFQAVNRGRPVPFEKPFWAYSYTEEDLKYRVHFTSTSALGEGGQIEEYDGGETKSLPNFSTFDSGYWWVELGGDFQDIVRQAEDIRDELVKTIYGVWDHLKNCGDHGAENYDLEWVGMVPGYRESRRLEGAYILTENDVRANRIFEDAVAYGGWPMDVHTPGGMHDLDKVPSVIYHFEGAYTIPYRCYHSANVPNLMMAGRNISLSKMAFSSARLMGTCAVGGQAVGTATAMAARQGIDPGDVDVKALQQCLLKQDCYLPGFRNSDPKDFAPLARVAANGSAPGHGPENVINGVGRATAEGENVWESAPLAQGPAVLQLFLDKVRRVGEILLTFDPNLTREIMPSITSLVRERQCQGLPDELVCRYQVDVKQDGETVWSREVTGNALRLNVLTPGVEGDMVQLTVTQTHGYPAARVFEVRLYE